MALTIKMKTVRGDEFDVSVQGDWTVLQVKEALVELKQYPLGNIKLICAGKVLKDAQTLAEVGVKEGTFMVVMVSKSKKAKKAKLTKPAAAASAAVPAATAAAATAAAPTTTDTTTDAGSDAAAPAASTTSAGAAAPSTVHPSLQQLTDMGFPLEQAQVALSAAFGDVSRAAEYLFNPSSMPQPVQLPTGAAAAAGGGGGGADEDPLAELRSHKQLAQIKAVIQKDPEKIKAVLDQIGKTKPDLLKRINENMQAFIDLMNEPINASSTTTPAAATSATPSSGGGGATGGSGGPPAGMEQVHAGMMQALGQMEGMPPAARQQLQQMMSSMTPEQMQQVVMQMMGGGGMGGFPPPMPGAGGAPGSGGGALPPGVTQIQLTQAEADDVNALAELVGGDRKSVV